MSAKLFMKYFAQNDLGIIAYIPMSWVKDWKSNGCLQFFPLRAGWPDGLPIMQVLHIWIRDKIFEKFNYA